VIDWNDNESIRLSKYAPSPPAAPTSTIGSSTSGATRKKHTNSSSVPTTGFHHA
jgi:hypothetical protein